VPSLGCRPGLELHLDAFGRGLGAHGLGLEHDVVEAVLVHLLPDLDQVAVGALHQAVHHFDHVQARAQRAVHRAHFQADDAAADDQHLLGTPCSASAPVESTTRGSSGMKQAHGLAAGGDDGLLERPPFAAGLVLAGAGGFFHLEVVGTDEGAVATHDGDLAHLGHLARPPVSLPMTFSLWPRSLSTSTWGAPKSTPAAERAPLAITAARQRLDAAHEADAAELA
jgi:hypothetical protein